MAIPLEDVKSILAAISHEKSAKSLSILVAEKSAPRVSRYLFVIKAGGGGKKMIAAKHVINWVGNVAMGYTGSLASPNTLGGLGSAVGSVGSKGSGVSGLGAAFRDGVMMSASDTGDLAANRNIMHQLKAVGGLQGFGMLSLLGSTQLELWIREVGDEPSWRIFIKWLDTDLAALDIGCDARGTLLQGQRVIQMTAQKARKY